MKIPQEMMSAALDSAAAQEPDPIERPPQFYLPEGTSVVRMWCGPDGDGMEWLREAWMYQKKQVGVFDGNCDFVKMITSKAKAADPDKKWAWQYSPQRIGIFKGCLYVDPPEEQAQGGIKWPEGSDEKYVRPNIPAIIVLNNMALKALKVFLSTEGAAVLMDQLDPDETKACIKFTLKRGSGGSCNVGWSMIKRDLPKPFTWGDNHKFPHLNDCFVNSQSVPTEQQKQLIMDELRTKIGHEEADDLPF